MLPTSPDSWWGAPELPVQLHECVFHTDIKAAHGKLYVRFFVEYSIARLMKRPEERMDLLRAAFVDLDKHLLDPQLVKEPVGKQWRKSIELCSLNVDFKDRDATLGVQVAELLSDLI